MVPNNKAGNMSSMKYSVPSSHFYCTSCGTANHAQSVFCYACGKPLQIATPPAHKAVKPEINSFLVNNSLLKMRYRILSKSGSGGFGAVYKAEDTLFGNRLVAVKEMIQENLAPSELTEAVEAFKREALLLANLTHPHLPSIYDYFSETGRWYVVMDFIEGETLEKHVQRSPRGYLPVEKVLDLGLQICSVLEYLHSRQPPIIFRDLKPANIMLTPGGYIYLIDFGVARHFKPGKSNDTVAFGSPGYAAPEQYGKSQTTPRSDIYSLGVTLYQLLSGRDPGRTPFQFTPLISPTIPPELSALIMRMLELEEQKRPESVTAIKLELQRISSRYAAGPVSAVMPVVGGQSPFNQDNPPSTGKLHQLSPFPSNSEPLPIWGRLIRTYRGHTHTLQTLAWSPRGNLIASAGEEPVVHVWDAATGNTVCRYHLHTKGIRSLAWSPDGQRIASASIDNTVQVWDVVTDLTNTQTVRNGAHVFTYFGHTSQVHAVSWSPDGRYIASASNDTTVQVWDAFMGQRILLYKGHTDFVWSVQWSPDGRYLASSSNDHTVRVWDALTGRDIQVYRAPACVAYALTWAPNSKFIAMGVSDHSVQIWDVITGNNLFVYQGHSDEVVSVAWSIDGKRLASGSADSTVRMWDTHTGNSIFTYRSHSRAVNAMGWSPDGGYLAYMSYDKTVDIWQIK